MMKGYLRRPTIACMVPREVLRWINKIHILNYLSLWNQHQTVKPSLIAFHLPTPMCKEIPTLGWGYVQTRKRRDKVCPLYRVLGSLRIWKNSAFGSLKICGLPAVACSPAQWICIQLVFGWRLLPSMRSPSPFPECFYTCGYFCADAAGQSVCPLTAFFGLSGVACSPAQWICIQLVFGWRLLPSVRSPSASLKVLQLWVFFLLILQVRSFKNIFL